MPSSIWRRVALRDPLNYSDADNAVYDGVFDFPSSGTNGPAVAAENAVLLVNSNGGTGTLTQTWVGRTTSKVYRRVKDSGTWRSWGPISGRQTVNAQTGTSYTFALTDEDQLVTFNNAAAVTATVPPNSSVAFPINAKIDIAGIGAGLVTVAQGAGVTVNATPTKVLRAQYSAASLIQLATDSWLLVGDMA